MNDRRNRATWRLGAAALAGTMLGLAPAAVLAQDKGDKTGEQALGEDLQQILESWDEGPRRCVEGLAKKYGAPDEFSEGLVLWHDNAPWKATVVFQEPVNHLFPKPHNDYLLQVIEYRVPVDKYDELATFDGSVLARRTPGLMAARSDQEATNFVALNLAHEVVRGKLSPEKARQRYADTVRALDRGDKPELAQALAFEVSPNTADPGESLGKGQVSQRKTQEAGTLPARYRPEEGAASQERPKSADEALKTWPSAVRETARKLIGKYGEPDEVLRSLLVWRNNDPWKTTILYRTPVQHLFPQPHYDYLQQVLDYRVPVDRFDEVTDFNGSVFLDRTKGEISCMCDQEALNIAALNLAQEVIEESKSIPEARQALGDAAEKIEKGQTPEVAKTLEIEGKTETADPDTPVVKPGED